MFLESIIYLFIFLLGLCIGSFLNVVIYRTEEEKSFIKGRSFCPNCKHNLNWKDLFPVFSYLLLGGECRYCKAKISWQYPAVEISTAIIFLLISLQATSYKLQAILNLVFWFYIASVLIVIFVYDLKHYLIPDNVLFPAIVIAFIYKVFVNLSFSNWNLIENWKLGIGNSFSILNLLLAVIIASGFFFLIWFLSSGKWMGFGDVKLAILLGLMLGLPNILTALFLAFFFGAIIGIILMIFQGRNVKSEIPFGPFLVVGFFVVLFWGNSLVTWYIKLIQF